MLHSTDRITSRATIVEGELKEEGELEPHRQGSIHSRWQRDKGAAENNRHVNQLICADENQWLDSG